jgi:hypothetical protein
MEDFDKLFNLEEINEVLDNLQYRDPERKEIGDRVTILDYSSCSHLNGQELDSEEDEEMQFNMMTYFVVIEIRQKYIFDAYYAKYRQDLIIVNPLTRKQFRINSGHVQIKRNGN